MIKITKLPQGRWKDYRALRLEALRKEPAAFGSSYREERKRKDWRRRFKSVFFALDGEKPVGMIMYVFSDRLKTKHIAHIYGFYVNKNYRGKGIGRLLMGRAMGAVKKNRRTNKVELSVVTTQKSAVKLYKSFGFAVSGKSRKALKVNGRFYDEFTMEKLL